MQGCIFATYIDICKQIMFTVQADHHGTTTRFHFHMNRGYKSLLNNHDLVSPTLVGHRLPYGVGTVATVASACGPCRVLVFGPKHAAT